MKIFGNMLGDENSLEPIYEEYRIKSRKDLSALTKRMNFSTRIICCLNDYTSSVLAPALNFW